MQQFSIKNDRAVTILKNITKKTGKGKTEVVLEALEAYQRNIYQDRDAEEVIKSIQENVHALISPEYLGKAPTKQEIEEDLGMP